MNCNRCGKPIKHPLFLKYKVKSVTLFSSIMEEVTDETFLCDGCAESFRKWLYIKNIDDTNI